MLYEKGTGPPKVESFLQDYIHSVNFSNKISQPCENSRWLATPLFRLDDRGVSCCGNNPL